MKSYFRILSALSAVAAVIAFSGCGGKEQEQPKPDSVKVSGVSIDKPTLSMTEGETANLTAIVMPENATNKAVAWKSGNSGVADVDASGKVTAVKAGTSDITVTTADGGKTATCKVTVASKAVPATGLTLSLSSVAFVEGQTKSINATVTPSNSTDEVVWPSPAQLTSNGGGSYTAKKADDSESFDLEVKAGAASAKAGVTVYPMWFVDTASDKLVPDGSTSTITEGGELTCCFSKKKSGIKGSDYIGDDILPAGDFTVSSSEAGIATVEKVVVSGKYNGFKVVGKKLGSSTITVKTGDVSRSFKVTVVSKAVPAKSITLKPTSIAFVEGQTKSINATVAPSNTTDEVVWPSPAQLTSNGGGSYTAKKADDSESFDLEVKAGAASAKAGVTVYPMWFVEFLTDKLVPDGSTSTITEGGELTCYFSKKKTGITGDFYIGDDILPADDFTVSSSEAGIATVEKVVVSSKYNGFRVVGKKLGSSTITVKIGDVSRSIKVTVTEKAVPAKSITLSPTSVVFIEGQTKSINATVTPSNTTDEVVWPSSSYLTSNGGGSYTAKKADDSESFNLEVKAGAASAKASVTVYPMWFADFYTDKLVPDGSANTIAVGDNLTCYFSKKKTGITGDSYFGNDILPAGDFTVSSSEAGIATVEKVAVSGRYNGFRVVGKKLGSSTITVKIGNVSRSFKVTVTEKTVPATGLTVSPQKIAFVEGQTKSFSAAVTPSNSTDNVVWPNSSYLTSNGGGSYTAKKHGFDDHISFDLEVKAGAASAKARVTVYPMWFVNHEEKTMIPYGSTEKITKGGAIACYFSKTNGNVTSESSYIGHDILSGTDFTVSSSNTGIASVANVGTLDGRCTGFGVWAEAVGTATITVKIGHVSRSFKVTVTDKTVPATGLDVTPRNLTFVEGQTKSFSATVTPSNSTDNVVWPNSSYLTSNGGGTYTANKLGVDIPIGFELDVKAGSVTKKAGVTVYPMWFARLNDNKYEFVPNGSTYKLDKNIRMTCYFSKKNFDITDDHIIDNRILPKGDFTVTSSNNSVATVGKVTMGGGEWNGFSVSALNAGRSTITVKIGSVSRSFDVLVRVPATGITLNPTSLFFVEGQTKSFSATVTPFNSTDEVVWSDHFLFENKGGGTYTANRVTKIRDGQITVKAGSVSVKADVTVYPMYFFDFYTKKSHYDTSTTSDRVVLKKGQKAFICFSKTGKYKSKADLVDRSILSENEIKVFCSKSYPLLAAKVVTYEGKYPGIEIEALRDGASEAVYVAIGKVDKYFDVYVKK